MFDSPDSHHEPQRSASRHRLVVIIIYSAPQISNKQHIHPSLYSSNKGSLQLHQLATMILESSLVYSSDNYIVLHPVVGIYTA